jgi:DUF1680 family protein
MTLDQAQKLVADLGTQLGGNSSTFTMSEQGEANFLFEGKIPLQIRHFENTLIIAASVATGKKQATSVLSRYAAVAARRLDSASSSARCATADGPTRSSSRRRARTTR